MTARSEKSRSAIKDALLELLGTERLDAISMSELAAQAHVSRSTLYAHYANAYEVFEDAVRDFSRTLQSLNEHLSCEGCESGSGLRPFCVALRDAGKYRHLVRDHSFLPTLLGPDAESGSVTPAWRGGAEGGRADVLTLFQMSGCYAAAMSIPADADWAPVQKLIDAYVAAGTGTSAIQQVIGRLPRTGQQG